MSTVPTSTVPTGTVSTRKVPTSITLVTSTPPYSTRFGPVSQGPPHDPGLFAYAPFLTSPLPGSGLFHGPAITEAVSTPSLFTSSTSVGYVPVFSSFQNTITAPLFAPTFFTFSSGFPGTFAPLSTTHHPTGVYTPDAWIQTLGTSHAAPGRSSIKPTRLKAPSFDGNPRNWSMFIQMLKVFVHDAGSSDAERIAHFHDALTPAIRKDIGEELLNPGLPTRP